ncbi:V-set domain-containing T-cell activation inhibitor 1 [Haplochromis burtoni]|uniref:V-set domain-containing T-cell activation inhibitor 1 n=1 Tax=Haplochromis burtoni TaxID=8153 RepID=UPI001C2D9C51|nr:V-set domain-containing T-cell activation inhibitor 1 [Haplochromis burtoni]
MKMLLFVLLSVSQHALAVVVEVTEGERSVLLPCLFSSITPEDDPTVMWTRSDLDPKSVHQRGEGGDDLRGQNQRYRERTSMRPDALDSSDFSLTLRKPTKSDSGNYTCSISAGSDERRVGDIQLKVKDQQVEVKVEEGSDSVILPCKTTPDLPEDTRVEWTRSEVGLITVHEYSNRNDDLMTQDEVYRDRTKMNEDLLRTGDLSLTLKQPKVKDTGRYICTIYRDKDILRQKVVLQVKDQQVEVKVREGSQFVILPCNTTPDLPEDSTVEWTRSDLGLITVHEYSNRNDELMTQDEVYRDRTKMNEDLLRTGDLSLTLKQPKVKDTGRYICTIYRDKDILRQKVVLQVKEPFPSWSKVLVGLLVLLVVLGVSGGLFFHLRQYFMSGECLLLHYP